MNIEVKHLTDPEQIADAFRVRKEVFQDEQGVSAYDDFDGLDAAAEQFVAYDGDVAIGTARYRTVGENVAKVERVAVISEYRGRKVGQAIMNTVHRIANEQQLELLQLNSQLDAVEFYKSLGYTIVSEIFSEANIPHIKMSLDLTKLSIQSPAAETSS